MARKTEISVYEKIEMHLFKSVDETKLELTLKDLEVKKRILLCVSKKMDNPLMQNSELVRFLMDGGIVTQILKDGDGVEYEDISVQLFTPVSQAQAYNDIAGITKIVGNISLSAKSWYRYMIIEGCKKGYEIAVAENDAAGIAANMDKIGKYTRADKEDEDFDWTQMIPPSFEPSDDVSLLENMQPIEDLETVRKEFRSIFKREIFKNAEVIDSK